jgi:hypothetical protein
MVVLLYLLEAALGYAWEDLAATEEMDMLEEQTIVPMLESHQMHDLEDKRLQEYYNFLRVHAGGTCYNSYTGPPRQGRLVIVSVSDSE